MTRGFVSSTSLAALLLLTGTAFAAKSAQDFIKDAIQGDNSEIMLGQLAQQKGGNQQVKDFGKTLVTDHTQAKQDMTALAKTAGVTVPDQPMPEAQSEEAKLSKMSGDDFDREFANYMVQDHQKDIQEFQAQAKANEGQTSAMASKQLPVLEKHLQIAQSLAGNAAQNGGDNATQNGGDSAAQNNGAPAALATAPTQEPSDEWRASKLAGVAVYGPDNKKVGNITDVLMTRDGKAVSVVVGVGGFLGLGEKDVAIPFEQVTFTDQPMRNTSGGAGNANTAANGGDAMGGAAPATGTNAGVGMAPAATVGLGTPATDANGNAAGGATLGAVPANTVANANMGSGAARSTAAPDHGTIDMTADQLKKAPTFHFAR